MRDADTQRWISVTLPGTPPSVNELPLDSSNPAYRRARDEWIEAMYYAFHEAGNLLPRGLATVRASAVLTFATNRRRDSGNYEAMICKWLGDTLQIRHLSDDTHDRYQFDRVSIIVDPTVQPGHFIIIDYTLEDP